MGIDRGEGDLADYVLSKIDSESLTEIEKAIEEAEKLILGKIHD